MNTLITMLGSSLLAELVAVILTGLLIALAVRWRRDTQKAVASIGESEERYRNMLEETGDLVYTQDLEGCIISMNQAGAETLGYEPQELDGKNVSRLLAHEHNGWTSNIVSRHLEGQAHISSELLLRQKNGKHTAMEVTTHLVRNHGRPVAIQAIGRNPAERSQAKELAYLATHDPLTKLLNRTGFEQELELQLDRAIHENSECALLYLDLDHFKDVNDSMGHPTGDHLLQVVGRLFQEGMRDIDALGRLGGDEFSMILAHASLAEAQAVADRILTSLRTSSPELAGRPFKISASIGIAMMPAHGKTTTELLSAADLAMYRAKDGGRNRWQVFPTGTNLQSEVSARVAWRTQIASALEHKRLRIYAQPILDLQRNQVTQYELLLRMVSQDGEIVEAGRFIESAERFGLIQPLDRWAMVQAIELIASCAQWNMDEIVLETNLSGRAFSDPELLPLIRKAFARTKADPSRLVVEVTETAAIENISEAQKFVAELKEIGCRFALDDFGSGFSSFQQLKTLDVDFLKIDGSLVEGLANDVVNQHVVKAIVDMARAMEKQTIAEYVSDTETLELVRDLGVMFAQGYAIGKPEDAKKTVIEDRLLPSPVAPSEPGTARAQNVA